MNAQGSDNEQQPIFAAIPVETRELSFTLAACITRHLNSVFMRQLLLFKLFFMSNRIRTNAARQMTQIFERNIKYFSHVMNRRVS
jgi:hypothetical protein